MNSSIQVHHTLQEFGEMWLKGGIFESKRCITVRSPSKNLVPPLRINEERGFLRGNELSARCGEKAEYVDRESALGVPRLSHPGAISTMSRCMLGGGGPHKKAGRDC